MSSRRNSHSARSILWLLLTAVCGFGVLLYFRGGTGAAASVVFTPIISVKTWFLESGAGLPMYFRTRQALIGEIRSLEEQLQVKDGDAFMIKQLQAENEALSESLNLKKDGRIVASVLARPNQTPYDTFLIDQGTRDGIVDGTVVYIEGNIAVGVIADAYANSALVRLVSSPGAKATAYVFGPNIFTEAEGIGGGVLRVTVPQGIPLAEGDIVVLPAAGAGAYGEIIAVETLASSPEQYGYVTTPVPLASVRYVSVAKELAPEISYQTALDIVKAASKTLFSITIPKGILASTTIATTTPVAIPPAED